MRVSRRAIPQDERNRRRGGWLHSAGARPGPRPEEAGGDDRLPGDGHVHGPARGPAQQPARSRSTSRCSTASSSRTGRGSTAPHIIESWQWTDGKMGMAVKIRQGIKFHDGSELTAEDVAFSMNRLKEDSSIYKGDLREGQGVPGPRQGHAPARLRALRSVVPALARLPGRLRRAPGLLQVARRGRQGAEPRSSPGSRWYSARTRSSPFTPGSTLVQEASMGTGRARRRSSARCSRWSPTRPRGSPRSCRGTRTSRPRCPSRSSVGSPPSRRLEGREAASSPTWRRSS